LPVHLEIRLLSKRPCGSAPRPRSTTQLYERKLAALEELKQSLLQQAFNGEL
jgi:hypothetical protein